VTRLEGDILDTLNMRSVPSYSQNSAKILLSPESCYGSCKDVFSVQSASKIDPTEVDSEPGVKFDQLDQD